jgi:hypothetical protein
MTGNLQEFIGMVTFVTAATFFVVGLRYAIYKFGNKFAKKADSTLLASERRK